MTLCCIRINEPGKSEVTYIMFHFNNQKTKKRMAAVIVIFLVLAMVIPTLSYFMF